MNEVTDGAGTSVEMNRTSNSVGSDELGSADADATPHTAITSARRRDVLERSSI
jgi:hypothetical protein